MYSHLLITYGELALKGLNRPSFEAKLIANIRSALPQIPKERIYRTRGRCFVHLEGEPLDKILPALSRVFGITSISPALAVEKDVAKIQEAAWQVTEERLKQGVPFTFKVETRRADKKFPITSPELSRAVAAAVIRKAAEKYPGLLTVDVHEPQLLVEVEVREEGAYIYGEKHSGPGGLPVGTSGRTLLMLSGGIDSPVAGWMMQKRGVELGAVHFHSYPLTSERSKQKVIELAQVLASWGGSLPLYLVHFTEIQKALHAKTPEKLRVILMRRMMMRLANRLAAQHKYQAIVTGESLGQVASQTLDSLHVVNCLSELPVLRPLIGMDKEEIVQRAEGIGTYELSVQPYEDCCTLFVPKHPVTRPTLGPLEEAEKALPVEDLLDEAIAKTEQLVITPENNMW
ncbi:MAG TPA: tRNA uracil 4-sulfurtransferase ThiI [Bacillota bacterium]|jgi:thiamine biosynthesis protein ThiI|nr:tRNA uracil 4-sulfurtransferase ThiI [Bacillota bacterium]